MDFIINITYLTQKYRKNQILFLYSINKIHHKEKKNNYINKLRFIFTNAVIKYLY